MQTSRHHIQIDADLRSWVAEEAARIAPIAQLSSRRRSQNNNAISEASQVRDLHVVPDSWLKIKETAREMAARKKAF